MAYSDLEILARIIKCEAGGEGENGMKAVASVVMNRVNVTYGEYSRYKTVREVAHQPGHRPMVLQSVQSRVPSQFPHQGGRLCHPHRRPLFLQPDRRICGDLTKPIFRRL